MFKKLLCAHVFTKNKLIRSVRVGNDNHVIEVTTNVCDKCSKHKSSEELVRVEKNWYLKNR